jgi:hypothetical protein
MLRHFSLADRRRYPQGFVLVAAIAYASLFFGFPARSHDLVIPLTGVLAGLGYFLYAQHLQETRLFVELFRQFNERYDKLNDDLNRIRGATSSGVFAPTDQQLLFDYFNLCAEEYLYFKGGYIDVEVWKSWARGMSYFAEKKDIERLWESELKHQSYYGFKLSLLKET